MTPTNTKQLRDFVTDLFQDVDNESRIDTDVANAICDVHVAKLEKLWQAHEQGVREEERSRIAELIDFDMEEVCLKTGCVNNKEDLLKSLSTNDKEGV